MQLINRRQFDHDARRQGLQTSPERLSDAVLLSEAARRGYEITRLEPDVSGLGPDISSLQADAAAFVNPDHRIDVVDQLIFTARVRKLFGQFGALSAVTPYRRDTIKERLAHNPKFRVNPTMLGAVHERRANASPREGSIIAGIIKIEELWMPADSEGEGAEKWGQLWTPAGGPVFDNGRYFESTKKEIEAHDPYTLKRYDLRYLTPYGEFLPRPDYVRRLLAGRQAARAQGEVWTYPVMDMSNRLSRRGLTDSVKSLHGKANPVISPEALINDQWINILAGKPLHQDIVDIANEVICELDDLGNAVKVVGATAITNARHDDGSLELIRHPWHNAKNQGGDYQLVDGISGIGGKRVSKPKLD